MKVVRLQPIVIDTELDEKRKRIDALSTKMLFDRTILDQHKYADATKLISDIIYPLKMATLERKVSNPEDKIHASHYKTQD